VPEISQKEQPRDCVLEPRKPIENPLRNTQHEPVPDAVARSTARGKCGKQMASNPASMAARNTVAQRGVGQHLEPMPQPAGTARGLGHSPSGMACCAAVWGPSYSRPPHHHATEVAERLNARIALEAVH
jgi:hypothetical protein